MAYYTDAYLVNIRTCLNRAIGIRSVQDAIATSYLTEKCHDCNNPVPELCTLNMWSSLVNSWNNSTPDGNTITEMNFRLVIANIALALSCAQTNVNTLSVLITPASPTVTEGANVTFTAAISGGTGPFAHQWQRSTDGGTNWINITGATNATYSLTPATLSNAAKYRDVVTDALSATANSNVATLIVNTLANVLPTVNAGNDQTITLPTSAATLSGIAADSDGTITAYLWSKVSGPAGGTIVSPSTAATALSALQEGIYVYNLHVVDNSGAVADDTVTITVNPVPQTLSFSYGYSANNPYSDGATPATMNNSTTQSISNNANISFTLPNAAVDNFWWVRELASQPTKVSWYHNTENSGTVNVNVVRSWVVGLYRYYSTVNEFALTPTDSIQLTQ